MTLEPSPVPDDIDALRAALSAEQEARHAAEARVAGAGAVIAQLKLLIAKYQRDRFGPTSERSRGLLDQLEFQLEELETNAAEADARQSETADTVRSFTRAKPVRAPLPAHLPRERVVIPDPTACPCCNGKLVKLGETITQPPAPFHPIARGRAGPNLLAMILESKFGQGLPLNRQSETYAREGIYLDVSTLADWVGACTVTLAPLVAMIQAHVLAGERIHGDDTTVQVLAKIKTIIGHLWTYVRDDRPFGGPAPPAAVFYYSRDREGVHPQQHLAAYAAILQADAYGGFGKLYEAKRQPGPITEAACWVHGRRKFYVLADLAHNARRKAQGKTTAAISPLALEAVRRIDALFDIEREINGKPATERLATRQQRSSTLVAELEVWMRGERAANIYTLIITAKLNDIDPRAWLADVLARIADHPASKLDELLPWNWARERERHTLAA